MEMMNPNSVIELPVGRTQEFRGIAFDGRFFYITAPRECVIHKFDRKFAAADGISVIRQYAAICYDTREESFWATEDKRNNVIYKLDLRLKEIGQLELKADREFCGPIRGLSFDCEKNVLLAAYPDYIVEISKQTGCVNVLRGNHPGNYTAVLSIALYYAFIWHDRCKNRKNQEILFYVERDRLVRNLFTSEKYWIRDFLFYPCRTSDKSELELIFLATECGKPVILRYTMKACGMVPDSCNYMVCEDKDMDDGCKPCKPAKPAECNACCELLESIASVEASLAHILNAEGEKLQKAVQIARDIDELLEANDSVSKAIMNAAHLEYMLLNKLEAINGICINTKLSLKQ